jgi:hypothetical protein
VWIISIPLPQRKDVKIWLHLNIATHDELQFKGNTPQDLHEYLFSLHKHIEDAMLKLEKGFK